jgi:glucose/mannose transport system permease protein
VVIAGIWQSAGFAMALFLAGLRGIDDSIIKAAQIDGAIAAAHLLAHHPADPAPGGVLHHHGAVAPVHQEFRPGDGADGRRPRFATDVPATFMYVMSFTRGQIGLGAASATMMLATVAAIVVPYLYSELRSKPHDR